MPVLRHPLRFTGGLPQQSRALPPVPPPPCRRPVIAVASGSYRDCVVAACSPGGQRRARMRSVRPSGHGQRASERNAQAGTARAGRGGRGAAFPGKRRSLAVAQRFEPPPYPTPLGVWWRRSLFVMHFNGLQFANVALICQIAQQNQLLITCHPFSFSGRGSPPPWQEHQSHTPKPSKP